MFVVIKVHVKDIWQICEVLRFEDFISRSLQADNLEKLSCLIVHAVASVMLDQILV